ncbi:MAG: RluA family pseudouridine synthase [wastewater metagenome]|nr:RluA family pseudouridine synthase [Candidatus Loosdrechtia aerotolerans]
MPIRTFTFTDRNSKNTLLDFIARKLSLSKKKAKQLLDKRQVFVNTKRVWIASYQLQRGDIVEILTEEVPSLQLPHNFILFQNKHYVIVSKPPDILTNGPESLEVILRERFHNKTIQAVHRLDKNTSGAVIFAMHKEAFERMKTLFKKNLVKKIYRVIVKGHVRKQVFTIGTPIHGQRAVTHVTLLKRGTTASYLEADIETGRTHQIRIHLASIGHPVIGETEYDRRPVENPLARQIGRHMLHAYQITFPHPYTHTTVSATADIPDDFSQGLRMLGLTE